MKLLVSILMIGFFYLYLEMALANPFASKLLSTSNNMPITNSETLIFKGFAKIDDKYYALIQIGRTEFEVMEGTVVCGYKILKISEFKLDYQIKDQIKSVVMDSK